MKNPAHHSRNFHECFPAVTSDCMSVLEVGCGNGNHLRNVRNATRRVGIEVVPDYPIYGGGVEFIIGNALNELPRFADETFDLVLLLDVIEHFEKEHGLLVLREAQRVAGKRVVLWIPEGFCPQNQTYYDAPEYPYRPSQDHISQWSRSELAGLGFDVAAWENYHFRRDTGEKSVAALFCIWERVKIESEAIA